MGAQTENSAFHHPGRPPTLTQRKPPTDAPRLTQIRRAAQTAPGAIRGALDALVQSTEELVVDCAAQYEVLGAAPDPFVQSLQSAAGALSEHFNRHPLNVGALLNFHFELQRFVKLVEALSDHSLFDVQTFLGARSNLEADGEAEQDGSDAALCLRNVAPACFLRQRFKALHSVTLFSATLSPPQYAIQLLGLPENTAWIDVPPAFAAEHLTVRVADGISTRFAHRERSLQRLVGVVAQQFDEHPGNYLAFFSSFDYLEKVAAWLSTVRPDIPQWRQARRMNAGARADFLARFSPQIQGIGFAVLGGGFADDYGSYQQHSWLRIPAGGSLRPRGTEPCELYIKEGGFTYLQQD